MNKLSLRFFNIYHHIFGEHFNKRIDYKFPSNVMRWDLIKEVIKRKNFRTTVEKLTSIIELENIGGVVIGWPLNIDGTQGPRCDSTRDFAHAFLRKYKIPICFHDERLSSIAADNLLKDTNLKRKQKEKKLDAVAASWILQSLLDVYNNKNLEVLNG